MQTTKTTRTWSPPVWLALLAAAAAGPVAGAADGLVIEGCIVSLDEEGEAQVAAREAGVIEELRARKGMEVAAGADLAILDSDQPRMELEKAQAELEQARAKAANDVNERFAVKSEEVAAAAFEKARAAEERSEKAVGLQELNRLRLEWEKAKLSIEQAQMDSGLATLEAKVKQVAVDAATHAIARRRIRSPITGMVLDVFKHQGEWVQPGDVLAHVIRTDVVQVEGFVDRRRAQGVVKGTPVTVLLATGGGKLEEFAGTITYVRPKEESGEYRVYAKVANRKAGDSWLLQLGQEVAMRVLVGAPPPAGE